MAEVFANFLLLVSMLIKLDLPTLERPIKAYSGAWVEGHFPTEELLMTNSADLISEVAGDRFEDRHAVSSTPVEAGCTGG